MQPLHFHAYLCKENKIVLCTRGGSLRNTAMNVSMDYTAKDAIMIPRIEFHLRYTGNASLE